MATASAATRKANKLERELDQSMEYASVKRMNMIFGKVFDWKPLKKVSDELGIEPTKVHDVNYGQVNAYHADVWREAYELEIPRSH
jgi:hypothetical protein